MGASGGGGTANLYVQDGLIAMYDGIENAGAGTHSASATTWVDLSGNGHDMAISGTNASSNWQSDFYNFNAASGTNGQKFVVDATNMGSIVFLECHIDFVGSNSLTLLHYKDDFGIYFDPRQNGYIVRSLNTITGGKAITWEKGTFSYDLSNIKAYQNTVECGGRSQGRIEANNGNTELIVGAKLQNGYRGYSKSHLYSLRLYNRVLTEEEIAANYAIDQQRFGLT